MKASFFRQQGAFSPGFILMLVGAVTFVVTTSSIIRAYQDHDRLSGVADIALLSASDSDTPANDVSALLKANRLQANAQIQAGEAGASLRLTSQSQDIPIGVKASTRQVQSSVEIAVVIDISESMRGEPLNQVKQGLEDFAEVLYAKERRNNNRVISLVPASGYVNIGPHPTFFEPASLLPPFSLQTLFSEKNWGNFLHPSVPGRSRDAFCAFLPEDVDDISKSAQVTSRWIRTLEFAPGRGPSIRLHFSTQRPAVTKYADGTPLKAAYPSDNPADRYREDALASLGVFDAADCGVSPILAMARTQHEYQQGIAQLYPGMNTNTAEGVLWAWRLLSPHWRGLWRTELAELPRDYEAPNTVKVMVLLSDGEHKVNPAVRDKKQVALCREMKKQGIQVFSIGYGNNAQIVRQCAGPDGYYAANERNIRTVFSVIANTINDITLVK
ncbi:VWA domain-containing protein [Photobacterium sp. 1_MG-2023]|uniref:vWA domain-containing protein n=1 Tax=Photobacterium sp. 1_MG-2023 TaxID=3062646 RepID=UPI0026E190B4|nr:VWA domain-containing protein [Photobacterium sp. 1_MG-2023]MDO6708211.1 VWA domain-containing protein [Photobacterium sp. 1_MG-2023]